MSVTLGVHVRIPAPERYRAEMLFWIVAACCHKPTEPAAAGDCSALSDSLRRVHAGEDVPGVAIDGKQRVQVVVNGEFKGSSSFDEEVRAGGLVQGWVPVSALCEVADSAGVTKVRVPERASPK